MWITEKLQTVELSLLFKHSVYPTWNISKKYILDIFFFLEHAGISSGQEEPQ